jgi:S-adenosylmethionine:tRNA ribosyltransferase-isomerase
MEFFRRAGLPPLPPYIHREESVGEEREMDKRRYQTIYAREHGSVAAPTAGLHFSRGMLDKIQDAGARIAHVTLHVGWGTFRPIRGDFRRHRLDPEWGRLTPEAAGAINTTLAGGGRVLAVGTTSARLVEARSKAEGQVAPGEGWVDLYITPGYRFRVVKAMLTNFHLPRSSLLLLVNALAGSRLVRKAYREALVQNYRFYSYGDAMLIL